MIQRVDAPTNTFLTDLTGISRRIDKAQREVTSGLRINRASDSPDELSLLLQLRTELKQTEQIRSNLGRVQSEVDTGEQVLQTAVSIMERTAVLGVRGVNGVVSGEDRNIIANEVDGLLEQMVGLADTRVEARYIFSGDADGQAPYSIDLQLPDPVSDYQGSAATRQVMHPSGNLIDIARTAEEIFDNADPDKNAFQAINDLRLALRADDEAAIEASLEKIRTAELHVNDMLAAYGTVQNQVAEATNFAYKQETRYKIRISEVQDADMTESILALNQATYQQKVALSSKAQYRQISLFDYIG